VRQFLWAEIITGAEMHRRMSVQYGDSVVSQQIAYEWNERLRNGCTSIKNEEGDGRPSMSITDANTQQVFGMILQNRWVTIDEVAHKLQISRGSAYEIIHNRLAICRVFS
jgi:transposase